ncbi:MAG TPA: ribonuclease HII [Methanomicrobia archaeon]|nr:ribonuclease HII [Methanomicrobia archaeon]
MREIGIDEAGKGPVIGSLFIAGVQCFDGLELLGVRDSKRLTPARREALAAQIEAATEVFVVEMRAHEIDERRRARTMNEIMVERFADVLTHFLADRAIVDAADVKPERFAANLGACYRNACGGEIALISENRADERYPLVSAASIVAKVHRDRSIRALEAELGCTIGSGYPSDAKTIQFLHTLQKDHDFDDLPHYVRRSWRTVQYLYTHSGF